MNTDWVYRAYTRLYGLFHPMEKKILFSSFSGRQYSDNPRAVCEKMHQLYPDYRLVWRLRSEEDPYSLVPDYVEKKKMEGRFSFYQELATSCCYVTNEGITSTFAKRKGQFFVQTWHGDRPFKKVLYDVPGYGNKKSGILIDDKVTDLCVAGSDAGEQQFRSAFRYKGEVLKAGTPRNDKLLQNSEEEKKVIRNRLGLGDEKLLLYAPTFRDGQKNKQEVIDLPRVLDALKQDGHSWKCLARAHASSKGLNVGSQNDIMNVSAYPDMADLMLISDLLITDYSSCAGDFVITGKGVILAIFDKEEYVKNCRDFSIDPKDARFLIAENMDQLIQIISDTSDGGYQKNCREVADFFHIQESGAAAEAVCRRIDSAYRAAR